jgi:glycosyltransferase involved in cell wall biosynthesis
MYPQSLLVDNSYKNFEDKRKAFTGHPNLTIVTPSKWLKDQVNQSFLHNYPVEVIHNGINLKQFRVLDMVESDTVNPNKKIILGVASVWEERKGLQDFIKLHDILPADFQIVLIGLDKQQLKELPEGIKGLSRTEHIEELVKWYNMADVFVNPTYEDNFPTTNLESLACGTPVVTYDTGGSPEAISEKVGMVVPKGILNQLRKGIEEIIHKQKKYSSDSCRSRAVHCFNKEERFLEYYDLYQTIVN